MIADVDLNGNGKVEFDEFLVMMSKKAGLLLIIIIKGLQMVYLRTSAATKDIINWWIYAILVCSSIEKMKFLFLYKCVPLITASVLRVLSVLTLE